MKNKNFIFKMMDYYIIRNMNYYIIYKILRRGKL